MNDITDRQLQLRFRATSARVLDSNRKFLEAADRYYELSSATDTGVSILRMEVMTSRSLSGCLCCRYAKMIFLSYLGKQSLVSR
jgi:hypothetical protein